MIEYPQYLKINGSAVVLSKECEDYAIYYRDAGAFSSMVMWNEGELTFFGFVNYGCGYTPKTGKVKCEPCTEEEWRNDNAGYV